MVVVVQYFFCFSPASRCVPSPLASVASSETASFIAAAPSPLRAQALNSWPEFRPQLRLSLFVCTSLSLPLIPLRPLFSSPHLKSPPFQPHCWHILNKRGVLFGQLIGKDLHKAEMHSPSCETQHLLFLLTPVSTIPLTEFCLGGMIISVFPMSYIHRALLSTTYHRVTPTKYSLGYVFIFKMCTAGWCEYWALLDSTGNAQLL